MPNRYSLSWSITFLLALCLRAVLAVGSDGAQTNAIKQNENRLTALAQRLSTTSEQPTSGAQPSSANEPVELGLNQPDEPQSDVRQQAGHSSMRSVSNADMSTQEQRPLGWNPPTSTSETTNNKVSEPSSWVLSTITALGIVLGLVVILRFVVGRWLGRPAVASSSPAVHVLTRVTIAPRNHILLLRVAGRVLVVGDSSQGLRTLANIDDPEEVASLLATVSAAKPNSMSRSFVGLLKRFNSEYTFGQNVAQEPTDPAEYRIGRARDQVSSVLSGIRSMAKRHLPIIGIVVLFMSGTGFAQSVTTQTMSNAASLDTTNPLSMLHEIAKVLPGENDDSNQSGLSAPISILLLLTVLTVAPALLVVTTSFTRIIVVLALLRQAIGTQSLPPSQVIVALSMFMTFLIMAPTFERIAAEAIVPLHNNEIDQRVGWKRAKQPLRDFMFDQIEHAGNEQDIYMILNYRGVNTSKPQELRRHHVDMLSLIPAFILSELKIAFLMGFRIYLPFLIIDMVIASVLISMGMLMLPPVLISLPFKLLLFVMVDGWHLVAGSVLSSFSIPGVTT